MRRRPPGPLVAMLSAAAVLAACSATETQDSSRPRESTASNDPRPTEIATAPPPPLTPGQLPPPTTAASAAAEPPGPVIEVDDEDAPAAAVAVRYAETAWAVLPGDGPAAWITRVAPLTTPEYQARLQAGGAGGASATPPVPNVARVTSVASLTPGASRWRFQVSVVVTATELGGPPPRGVSMIVDVADGPAGPRVAATR